MVGMQKDASAETLTIVFNMGAVKVGAITGEQGLILGLLKRLGRVEYQELRQISGLSEVSYNKAVAHLEGMEKVIRVGTVLYFVPVPKALEQMRDSAYALMAPEMAQESDKYLTPALPEIAPEVMPTSNPFTYGSGTAAQSRAREELYKFVVGRTKDYDAEHPDDAHVSQGVEADEVYEPEPIFGPLKTPFPEPKGKESKQESSGPYPTEQEVYEDICKLDKSRFKHLFTGEYDLHKLATEIYEFYESKGWKVGKAPAKNWHLCVTRALSAGTGWALKYGRVSGRDVAKAFDAHMSAVQHQQPVQQAPQLPQVSQAEQQYREGLIRARVIAKLGNGPQSTEFFSERPSPSEEIKFQRAIREFNAECEAEFNNLLLQTANVPTAQLEGVLYEL